MDISTARQELERTCGFEFVGSRVLVRDLALLSAIHELGREGTASLPPPGGAGAVSDERVVAALPR